MPSTVEMPSVSTPSFASPIAEYPFETRTSPDLAEIERLDNELYGQLSAITVTDPWLTRQMVSFQANKNRPSYRWYKYKEAFSANLVEYLIIRERIQAGVVLDPFAGMGTTLFAASDLGLDAHGMELLPIGQAVVSTRHLLEQRSHDDQLIDRLCYWSSQKPWLSSAPDWSLPTVRITERAYGLETEEAMSRYMTAAAKEDSTVRAALHLALLCILEAISYTRKDGQYLRWDVRSGRRQGAKQFNKGPIPTFDRAISAKIQEIALDLKGRRNPAGLFPSVKRKGNIRLIPGSCLELLPQQAPDSYDAILTSPPYCNRYDYTRTYALELALLSVGEVHLSRLRQEMLSCTVENRDKDLMGMKPSWDRPIHIARNHPLLTSILSYLERCRDNKRLNNSGIPRMVRGYFYEMSCVIAECFRLLRPGAPLFMVNDNVRYAGASVSVDMILSDIANKLGFEVEQILVLPQGKGNSSQQMGAHGRDVLRKCVYVWRRP